MGARNADSRRCPECGGSFAVTDSRPSSEIGVLTRRVIVCMSCGKKYITHETIVGANDGAVNVPSAKAVEFVKRVEDLVREIYGAHPGGLQPTVRAKMLSHGVPTWHPKFKSKPVAP